MRVLHIVTYASGGAYNAAKRISDGLTSAGIVSDILVFESDDKKNIRLCDCFVKVLFYKGLRKVNSILLRKHKRNKTDFSHEYFSSGIGSSRLIKKYDVIHLHWVSSGMISSSDLNALVKSGKRIVWTLHDMCPMTGGCHYANDCEGYRVNGCAVCPRLYENSQLAKKTVQLTKKIVENANIKIVGCSNWITSCAKNSVALKNVEAITIPNIMNFSTYKYSENKKRNKVIFGAVEVDRDERKGFKYFMEVVNDRRIIESGIEFVVFGNCDSGLFAPNTTFVGKINDENRMNELYSEAMVTLSLSKQENLSCVIMESLSCGVPVVAFDIGGNSDLIYNESMGRLAKPYNVDEIVCLLLELVNGDINHEYVAHDIREHFSTLSIVGRYVDEYVAD